MAEQQQKLRTIPKIDLGDISRYRGELMGLAMVFIMFFHIGLPRYDTFFGLMRLGNIGVDIFLFLSGIGLWFSWMKMPSMKRFFSRRYLRIYPAWLIVSCLYYIPRFHGGDALAWIDLAGDILINWDFWLNGELTFWYVPATMMLYIFAPAYMELIKRHPAYRWLPILMILWCVAVQWVAPINDAVGHLEIFWSRVPIFFIGINMGEMVRQGRRMDGMSIWLILLVFLAGLTLSLYLEQVKHGQFPLFIERLVYIPLTISAILLLNFFIRRTANRLKQCFRFLGTVSLEIYLIHVQFVLLYLPKHWGYWSKFVVMAIISIPLAWLLSKAADWISAQLSKCLPK